MDLKATVPLSENILLLQAFHSQENQYYVQIMTNNITFFVKLIFYHREVVKLDQFVVKLDQFVTFFSLSYVNIVP